MSHVDRLFRQRQARSATKIMESRLKFLHSAGLLDSEDRQLMEEACLEELEQASSLSGPAADGGGRESPEREYQELEHHVRTLHMQRPDHPPAAGGRASPPAAKANLSDDNDDEGSRLLRFPLFDLPLDCISLIVSSIEGEVSSSLALLASSTSAAAPLVAEAALDMCNQVAHQVGMSTSLLLQEQPSSTGRSDPQTALKALCWLEDVGRCAQVVGCGTAHTMVVSSSTGILQGCGTGAACGFEKEQEQLAPVEACGHLRAVSLSAGAKHTAALFEDGSVWTWGTSSSGRLAAGKHCMSSAAGGVFPQPLRPLKRIVMVSAGEDHTLFLNAYGQLLAAGQNAFGACGVVGNTALDGKAPRVLNSPTLVDCTNCPSGGAVFQCSAGSGFSVALMRSKAGTVLLTWGRGHNGQLGHGRAGCEAKPRCVTPEDDGGSSMYDGSALCGVAAGGSHSLAWDASGRCWAAGASSSYQLGLSHSSSRLIDVLCHTRTLKDHRVKSASAGFLHSLFLTSEGSVFSAGLPVTGVTNLRDPFHIRLPRTVVHIASGTNHCALMDSEGNVFTFGGTHCAALGRRPEKAGSLQDQISPMTPLLAPLFEEC